MDIIVGYISGIDPSVRTLPGAVYTIWWTVLLLVVIVIVPLAIGLSTGPYAPHFRFAVISLRC